MAKVGDKNARFQRTLPAVILWLAAAIVYSGSTYYVLLHGRTWATETAYLVKSFWYVTGVVAPYTAADATWSMPLYFYQLGVWQELVSVGHFAGRLLSIAMGAVSAIFLFAICRRLTANTSVAVAAVLIFVATPATTFYFATATPAATVSTVHLAAVWLIIAGLGRPCLWATVAMGLLCVALFFYSQNMILAVVVLAPLYVLALGKRRWLHGAILVVTMAAAAAALLLTFPDKLMQYALRLPVIAPLLESMGWTAPNFTLIDRGTVDPATIELAFDQLSLIDILDGFFLPYAGTVLFALLLFRLAGKGLRILWIAPLYFLWLTAAHYVGSAGYCGTCVLGYAPHFAAIGALAAALTLAMMARWARQNGVPAAALVVMGAVIAAAGNAFAPALAFSDQYKLFPLARISVDRTTTELAQIESLAQWVAAHTSPGEPLLVIHGLGSEAVPALPYAAFLAGHRIPVQSLGLAASHRTIKPNLSGAAREAVQAAIEEESLWTDATMARWINRDYDLILFQEDRTIDQSERLITITAHFNHAATTKFKGSSVFLFERRPEQ